MAVCDVAAIVLITIGITSIVASAFYRRALRNLQARYHMLQRLLLEQAELHEMSLEAYTAMLREAKRHTGGQQSR